jgi:hypothetical protein
VLAWTAAAVVVVALAIARYHAAMREPQPDFVGIFLPAARAVADGHSPYLVAGYYYTPWVAVLLAPVAHASWVAQAWTIARLVVAAAVCLIGALAFTPGRAGWIRAGVFAFAGATVLALLAVSLWRPGPAAIALFDVVLLVLLLLPVSHYYYLLLALPALWWWFAEAIRAPRRVGSWVAVSVLATWWVVVFRVAPEGGGFTSTTWPSLLRIFSFTLIAACVSVVAAARLHTAERSPRAVPLEMGAPA